MYSPRRPNESNWMPAKKLIKITVVDKPGVNETPNIFCNAYQPPTKKLKLAMTPPSTAMRFSGLAENPTSPLSPIRRDPKIAVIISFTGIT